ncbi:L-aspartate oxidase, chloroplastic-like [Arachis ipaensis]|uniref:L-aspartate oxidase, chloroplastic-like n=1 Tax=Arachis ipaensis TaxID=130454 RepID=UPI0007AF7E60|nr:L-aspartate oxidase, chloroplastic-like [Arachis ipaensis]
MPIMRPSSVQSHVRPIAPSSTAQLHMRLTAPAPRAPPKPNPPFRPPHIRLIVPTSAAAPSSGVPNTTRTLMVSNETRNGASKTTTSRFSKFMTNQGNSVASYAGNRGYPPNKVVCTEGPDRVRELIAISTSFDHGEDGNLPLVREGGHSHRRIVHAADMIGKEIERALLKSVVNNPNIFVFEHHFAIDLLTCQDGFDITCVGIDTLNTETLEVVRFLSKVTLLASGGAGHIYPKTTNPLVATGDGIAMAHRAQAVISNME